MEFNKEFIDKYGMVKPQQSWSDSGNGIYYTSLAVMFRFDFPNYKELVRACYKEEGLLLRNPSGSFGEQQFDDYLGVAVASIFTGDTSIPREILAYGFKHGFVFNTDGKSEGKDFLGRFPQVWLLMAAAAFPMLKWLFAPFLFLFAYFLKSKGEGNNSGDILANVFQRAVLKLYGITYFIKRSNTLYASRAFSEYYPINHPFNRIPK